jgi:hypothetical protein
MNMPIQSGNQESRKGGATASRLAAFFVLFVLIAVNLPAAQTNRPGVRLHANPAIARAIERREMKAAKPRVESQAILAGQVVSRMTDGTVVVTPLKRATTARIPEAIGRVRIDRALARIAAALEGTDNAKRARELEKLADKLEREKGNGNGKAAAAIGGALAAAAAGYLAGKKGRIA